MSNSQKVKFDMSSCLSSPEDLRDEENCMVRSRGFWNSSILPNLLLVARLFPCYTQDSLPLRCQSVSEMDLLDQIQEWPRPSEMFSTPRLTIGLDSWLMTLYLLMLTGNSRRMEVSQCDEYLTILSIFSSIAWISTELYFWLGMFSWKYSRLRYHCPVMELKYDGFCHFPTYVRKQGRSAVEYMALLLALKGPRDTRRE